MYYSYNYRKLTNILHEAFEKYYIVYRFSFILINCVYILNDLEINRISRIIQAYTFPPKKNLSGIHGFSRKGLVCVGMFIGA